MKHVRIVFLCMLLSFLVHAQMFHGKIFDASTKEPISNATITANNSVVLSKADGSFSLPVYVVTFTVSALGYEQKEVMVNTDTIKLNIALVRAVSQMEEVVVSAGRAKQKRTEAPVAIGVINNQTIEDAKAQRLDFLLNKVSGVFMVNLGNEQHEMSIRQPITTKSLFLYMEDGIPIRTTGVYNHNALLEMNLSAAKSIEVIKGPSSALYGAEAVGGAVNIITQRAPVYNTATVQGEINNNGYQKESIQIGGTIGKWGILASSYYAQKKGGILEYSDFYKKAITVRIDYRADDKTIWSNNLTWIDYYSDMTGTIDSAKFAARNYTSEQAFTYRKVGALRFKSTLNRQWNENIHTNISFLIRNNSVTQNPSYTISSTPDPTKFKSQINENAFNTLALFVTQSLKFSFLNSRFIAGANIEYSPQRYNAKFIWVNKDTISNKFLAFEKPEPDSFLSKYKTGIVNLASFISYECTPFKNLHIVLAGRYDAFQYHFNNNLPSSASVRTASTLNQFNHITPKLGITYNYRGIGFYTNYSQGFVPPQLTELYSSVKEAPYLLPQIFNNYEVGGWLSVTPKLYMDWSFYYMEGKNEIISVRQPDNSYVNENTGSTRHAGFEYSISIKPLQDVEIRISGTNARHRFIHYVSNGLDYSGNEMSGAPRFFANAEASYKPRIIKGLRISAECQYQGKYFMDDVDQHIYRGFNVFNLRTGYVFKQFELWINILNATNTYYSVYATKNSATNGSAAYAYNLGDPREYTAGVSYHLGKRTPND